MREMHDFFDMTFNWRLSTQPVSHSAIISKYGFNDNIEQ